MAERRFAVNGRVLRYSGSFSLTEMYNVIDGFFQENKFSGAMEVEHMEKITKDKKQIEIVYNPSKKFNNFTKLEVRLIITIEGLKRKVVDVDTKKTELDEGDVELIFDGIITTDYEKREENNPSFFFLSDIKNKLIFRYKHDAEEKAITGYVQDLYSKLRDYLYHQKRV